MTLSTGPWWCAPVLAFGWITTVPAQSFSAPVRARVMAAARFMPGVCGVLMSSSLDLTTRTPSNFHFGLPACMSLLWLRAEPRLRPIGRGKIVALAARALQPAAGGRRLAGPSLLLERFWQSER